MGLEDYFTQTLKKDESVVAIVRKHWISIVWPAFISLIVLGLLIGFFDLFFRTGWGLILWLVLMVGVVIFAAYHWVIHFFDSFIITDMRIIDIDQTGLFKRTVSETMLENVQDVTYTIAGLVATALDYGSVQVQTAAAEVKIEIEKVHQPKKVQETILEAHKLFQERYGGDMSAAELIDLISKVKAREAREKMEQHNDEEADNTEQEKE